MKNQHDREIGKTIPCQYGKAELEKISAKYNEESHNLFIQQICIKCFCVADFSDTGDSVVNKTDKVPVLTETIFNNN